MAWRFKTTSVNTFQFRDILSVTQYYRLIIPCLRQFTFESNNTHTTCLCVFLEADDTDDNTPDSKVHGAYWGRQAPGTLLSGTVKSFQNPLGMSVAEMEIISSDNDVLNNSPGFCNFIDICMFTDEAQVMLQDYSNMHTNETHNSNPLYSQVVINFRDFIDIYQYLDDKIINHRSYRHLTKIPSSTTLIQPHFTLEIFLMMLMIYFGLIIHWFKIS